MHTEQRKRAKIADLPKGISIYRQKSGADSKGHRKVGYTVRVGKKFSGMAPSLKFVENLDAARKFIDGLKPHQGTIKHSELSPEEVSQTILCLRLLKEKDAGLSLLQAVELALQYHDPSGGRKSISDVAAEMILSAERNGAKTTSIAQLKSLLKCIESSFGSRLVTTITSPEITEWAEDEDWSPRTKRNYIKQFSQLFGFAIRKQYTTKNPCDPVDRPHITDHERGILSVADTKKLLETAREHFPELIRFVATSAFGWVRRSEIVKLENAHFRSDGSILIPAEIAKNRNHRIIPINDTLKAWLAIAPESDRPCKSPNVDVMGERLKVLAEKAEVTIPHNGLRHSAISYALASAPMRKGKKMENGAGAIAKYAGNSETVIYSNYRQLVEEKNGKAYWNILPS